jgi:oligopeptide/dipeptide ABC transporter ATP-binding protein
VTHLLDVNELAVSFATDEGVVRADDHVSFFVDPGEIVCVVGESGSGKSVMSMTLMGLTRANNATFEGTAYFDGVELVHAPDAALQRIRGKDIALILQDPMAALNPVYRIGHQIAEQIRAHEHVSSRAAFGRAVQLMTRVGIPNAKERARAFPHEFSGGMRQRVIIAMAFSCSPQMLIADEPTTALDVTIQAQILADMTNLCRETGVALILVTHDFGVVAEMADRVAVMYGGRIVEQATVSELFEDPQHPYTWGLLGCVPRLDEARATRIPTIAGAAPPLAHPPPGCHFAPRCPHRFSACSETPPLVSQIPGHPDHRNRCWLEVAEKRRLRIVGDRIGLAPPTATVTVG